MKSKVKKVKLSFRIMTSLFGDIWIAKTKLKADESTIFSKFENAQEEALSIYEAQHPNWDSDDELIVAHGRLEDLTEKEVELLSPKMEKKVKNEEV